MKLTPFLAQEMLFEFATNKLDRSRSEAVKEFLKTDEQSQKVLADIRRSLQFCESFEDLEVSPELVQELAAEESLKMTLTRIIHPNSWPDSLRWSAIAVSISIFSAVLIVSVPWDRVQFFKDLRLPKSDLVEIAAVPRFGDGAQLPDTGTDGSDLTSADSDGSPIEESSGDEEFAAAPGGGMIPEAPGATLVNSKPGRVAAEGAAQSRSDLPSGKTDHRSGPGGETLATSGLESSTAAQASSASSTKPRGFVYRANMTLANPDEVNASLVLQLRELGSERAGEVELGWKRGTGRYYHFSLPETNEARLLEILNSYGPVRISKDPHPRVMPAGQVRFILWIEAGT